MPDIGDRINRYMIERSTLIRPMSKDAGGIPQTFGTTLNALRRFYAVDPDEYLNFVHDIPMDRHLQYAPELDPMLGG